MRFFLDRTAGRLAEDLRVESRAPKEFLWTFAPVPVPEGWPDRLDFLLGTVDRGYLEGEGLRQLWWEYGVGWIKEISARKMEDLPRHPNYEFV